MTGLSASFRDNVISDIGFSTMFLFLLVFNLMYCIFGRASQAACILVFESCFVLGSVANPPYPCSRSHMARGIIKAETTHQISDTSRQPAYFKTSRGSN